MLQTAAYAISQVMRVAQLPGTFDSLATIQAPDGGQGPTGNPPGTYTSIAGLIDIPCMDSPPSMARIQATEVKAVAEIMSKGMRHVLLNRRVDDAKDWSGRGYRCLIDGVVYDLLGAENSSQPLQGTRLDLQLVTV